MTRDPGLYLGDTFLSREALLRRSAQAAGGFAALGVGAGATVALLLRNDIPVFEASYGAAALGAYAVPINWHARAAEVEYILRDSDARVLVAHADLLHAIRPRLPCDLHVLTLETPPALREAFCVDAEAAAIPPGRTDWAEWLERQTPIFGHAPLGSETMIYTSGTTGHPKGVRRRPPTPEQASRIDAMRRLVYGIEPGIRSILPGPLYHSAPNAFGLRAGRVAERLVLMPRFDAEALLRLIEAHRATTLLMVPTMFVRLLSLPEVTRRRYDVSSLRHVIHAAAPCPVAVKRAMIEWWGPVVTEFYGATEIGAVTFCTSAEWLAHPGTVGRATDGATVKVLDDAGREVPPGAPGEIYSRITYFPDFTYHGQDEKRREIERDGLLTVGDVGFFDGEGYLYLCDRKRDMAIIGGTNVYPAEIEAVLIGLPGVKDCAVIGIPDDEYGEALLALVEPHDGLAPDPETLHRQLAEHFTGFKLPRRIELRSSLPREDSGKIFKRRLREPYWREAGRAI